MGIGDLRDLKKGVGWPGTRVPDGGEPPDEGVGNQA